MIVMNKERTPLKREGYLHQIGSTRLPTNSTRLPCVVFLSLPIYILPHKRPFFLEKSSHICQSKVFHPSPHILLILSFSLRIADALVSVYEFSDFVLHFGYRLQMNSESATAFTSVKSYT